MITYTVYEAPDAPADRLDRAESLEFVKEGFNWFASALPPIWLIAKRLWLGLALYVAAIGLIVAFVWAFGLDQRVLSPAVSALHLIIGFEADTLQRWTLERRGWAMLGSVNGRKAEDCERRFFDDWLPGQPYVRPEALAGSSMASQPEPVPFAGRAAEPAYAQASPAPAATSRRTGSGPGRWRSAFPFSKRS